MDALRPSRVRASLALAGERGAERAKRERDADAAALHPSALAYLGATRESEASLDAGEAGSLAERLELERLASDAASPSKLTPDQRATLRAAKRGKGRGERHLAHTMRPVHPLALADAGRADIKVEGRDKLTDKLSLLSEASARSFVRAWTANGGRDLAASEVEELSALYHTRFARAATVSGLVPPDKRALYQRGANVLPFRALLAWHRATRAGGTDCRSYLWGKGWERCEVVSADELQRARAVFMGADDERCHTVSSARTCQHEEPLDGEIEQEARAEREAGIRAAYVRRLCARWGDFLRVYWMLSGSRKWRASLGGDLLLLARAARVARGAGVEVLGEYLGEGDATKGALREAASQLRKRIAAGRILATDAATSDAADAVLEASKAARAAMAGARVKIEQRQRAEWLALEVVSSAL